MGSFVFVPGKDMNIVQDGERYFCRGCTHYCDRPTLAYGLGECICPCHEMWAKAVAAAKENAPKP